MKFFENNYYSRRKWTEIRDIKNIIDIKEIHTIKKEEDKKNELTEKEKEE